jgi:alpha-beta hydrolase superfamily lysophospholipase
MGLLSTLAGSLLLLRPFASETLLVLILAVGLVIAAIAEAVQGTREAPARWILGGMYLAGAALLILWPHIPLVAAGVVVGLLLIATGMLEVWSGLISTAPLPSFLVGAATGGLLVSLISGVVTLIFGLVSGLWVDAVSFPMALMLGARMALVGFGLLIDLWYPPTGFGRPTELQRIIGRVLALVAAASLIAAGISADGGRPSPSDFYAVDLPQKPVPGVLLRAGAIDPAGAAGSAIRLLYSSTDVNGVLVLASGVLYVPGATAGDSLPLVVWAHGETGTASACAPSVVGLASGGLGVVPQLLAQGYAVFAPDGLGQGASGRPSALIGIDGGHAILDGIRAVGQVPGVRLGGAVVWGFSQGAHSALWAGQLQPSYAPEVTLVGIAVDAPIFDPAVVIADQVTRGAATELPAYVLTSYAEAYPDVRVADYLSVPEQFLTAEVAARCGTVGWAVANWAAVLGAHGAWSTPPTSGALGARLSQNATGVLPVPLLVTQGADDQVVTSSLTDVAVAGRCHVGQVLEYHRYPGLGHRSPALPDAPQLADSLVWLKARFAGQPASNSCG